MIVNAADQSEHLDSRSSKVSSNNRHPCILAISGSKLSFENLWKIDHLSVNTDT